MIVISLQSGSNGNCIYVETGGAKLLFDAGICGVAAERRLASYGRDIRQVDALIISHDHSDHLRYAGVFQRKYGLPIYITPLTLEAGLRGGSLGRLDDLRLFLAGGSISFGKMTVQSFSTPHDGADGSVFVVDTGRKRLGIMTDLGHVFDGLEQLISTLDGVFIESNYDPAMLAAGPYPAFLQRRIKGPGGHLSNVESAGLLRAGDRLKWACLAHLSEQNNDPELALRTHRRIVNSNLKLCTASRYKASGVLTI
jgi:phosphoribosyl 1,2-cyclic phosphodiesterase